MKTYPNIHGIHNVPWGEDCVSFYKYDGSNLRMEWNKKKGWYKFGTRRRMFDATDKEYGRAIEIFQNTMADELTKVIKTKYKSEETIVFCEFVGDDSFAGWHNFNKPFELKIIDVGVLRRGFLIPTEFVDNFGHIKDMAKVVYQGKITSDYWASVKTDLSLKEGVVVKGTIKGKNPTHSLWFAKIKTNHWFDELKRRCDESEAFKQVLLDNLGEQNE